MPHMVRSVRLGTLGSDSIQQGARCPKRPETRERRVRSSPSLETWLPSLVKSASRRQRRSGIYRRAPTSHWVELARQGGGPARKGETTATTDCRSERTFPAENRGEREEKNLQIHPQRPLFDVLPIERHHFFKIHDGATAANLPQAGDAWLRAEPAEVPV